MILIIRLIRSNNIHQQQLFKSIFFFFLPHVSIICVLSVLCGELNVKAQDITIYVLII